MAEFELTTIVTKLLGRIEPIGESDYDKECLKNLKEWCALNYWITSQIVSVATHHQKYLYSVRKCSEEAESHCAEILEILKAELGNAIEEE